MLQSLASFDDDVICVLLTFCAVFHVVDQDGNKLYDGQVIDRIELVKYTRINSKNRAKLCTFVLILIWFFQSLGAGSLSFRAPPERSVEVEAEAAAAETRMVERRRICAGDFYFVFLFFELETSENLTKRELYDWGRKKRDGEVRAIWSVH